MIYEHINLTIPHSFISKSAIIINDMAFNTDNIVRSSMLIIDYLYLIILIDSWWKVRENAFEFRFRESQNNMKSERLVI